MQRERDTLLDDRTRLQQELSTVRADYRGLEEVSKRLEAQVPQMANEKLQMAKSLEDSMRKCDDVTRQKELLAEERGRLLEQLAVLKADDRTARFVGRPTHFLSHAWTYLLLGLVGALESFVARLPEGAPEPFFWFDCTTSSLAMPLLLLSFLLSFSSCCV